MKTVLLIVIVIIVAAVCARLGFWQLSRLEQRRTLNASVEQRQALPEIDIDSAVVADSLAFRRVRAWGMWDRNREIVVPNRPFNGVPGVIVVTPMVLRDGRGVLVERGWMPSPDARRVSLSGVAEEGTIEVRGLLRVPPRQEAVPSAPWPLYVRTLDPRALQDRFPYDLVGGVIRREAGPRIDSVGFRPAPPPELTDGPHLGYALQWFAFAAIALVGGAILARSQHRSRANAEASSLEA